MPFKKYAFLLFILYVFFCNRVFAQPIVFEKIGFEHGLKQENVTSICEDKDGYLWIGTIYGLYRYNGIEMKAFVNDGQNNKGLKHNLIRKVYYDKELDCILLGTEFGLCLYNPKQNKFTPISFIPLKPNEQLQIVQIKKDDEGNYWLATYHRGVYILDKNFKLKKHLTFAEESKKSREQTIAGFYFEGKEVYISSLYGVYVLNTETYTYSVVKNPDDFNSFTQFVQDPVNDSLLWSAVWGRGLTTLNKYTFTLRNYLLKEVSQIIGSENVVTDLLFDSSNKIVGCSNHGYFEFDVKKKAFRFMESDLKNPYALPPCFLQKIFKDSENIIWLASDRGLIKVNPYKQFIWNSELLLNESDCGPAVFMNDSVFCFMNLYNNHTYTQVNLHNNFIKQVKVNGWKEKFIEPIKICIDKFNAPIILTNQGFYKLNKQKDALVVMDIPKEKASTTYQDVIEKDGKLFIVADGKEIIIYDYVVNKLSKINVITNEGVAKDFLLRRIISSGNELWVQGRKGNIYCVNASTGKSELFYYECIGKANEISNICVQNNTAFLFTRFGEIYLLDRKTKKAVLQKLNLRHQLSLVWDAKTDRNQNIWVAGYNGLMKMDAAFNTTHVDLGKNLITNNIFSLCISPVSEMVFLNGPNVIVKPKEIKKTNQTIKLLIEEFEAVNTDSIDFKSNSVVLNHLSNSFYVKFSALEYYFPEQIEYSYQLEGYDNAPIFSRTNNIINYASIPPGDYVLVIKAFQKNNELRKGELRFQISIVPAIYQRMWFKILAIAFIFLLVFAAYYAIRVQRLKNKLAKLEKEKELSDVRRKISDDIHDEIGSGLTLISLQGQAAIRNLNKNTTSTKENIDKMVVNARKLTGSLSEIIWTVSPKNDSIKSFVAFVRNYLGECFELLDVKYIFTVPDEVEEIIMNAEVRRNLFLIIKESVNNTLKHGAASCIEISFNPMPDGNFTLAICDNGKGMDLEQVTLLGNGLASMKNRAEKMNCEFVITSKPGNGTKIMLKGSLI